jgi:hypothetical protein
MQSINNFNLVLTPHSFLAITRLVVILEAVHPTLHFISVFVLAKYVPRPSPSTLRAFPPNINYYCSQFRQTFIS